MAHGGDPAAVRTATPSIALQPVRPDTGLPDGGTIRFVEDEILDLVRGPDGVTMVTTRHRSYWVTPTPGKIGDMFKALQPGGAHLDDSLHPLPACDCAYCTYWRRGPE